ncbi:peptidoglycan/LPS O-acetylase OafA/YrhL [Bosea sp. BE125]|uniref:acyltransferase family protein n=1 Tax=Bosea sp. BE125 TaxID=2817909 RepID=UPI002863DF1C|nr:acyltransferase [Bosea sp. BE125]MDR6873015.1 peptidoglycan/LPS O-acetylase OafA/YrhL [Bosea sp. BE125]
MRVALAFAIVAWHTVIVSYGIDGQRSLALGPTRPIWAALLPMFFALSGFLVSGSLERSRTLFGFIGLRLLRLLPALAVESLVAMVVLGSIFTSYTLAQYLTDGNFWAYTSNIFGIIRYYLPGVFLENPTTQVNAQLWTLPYELYCYIAISLLFVFRFYQSTTLLITACIAVQIAVIILIYTRVQVDEGTVRGPVLVLSFLYGSLLYRLRHIIAWSFNLFALSTAVGSLLLYFPIINALAALPLAYLTVYLGLMNPPKSPIVSSGDYSYGIFLYGFPIQQAVSAAFPEFRHWWFNLIVSAPIVFLVAYASWHMIEKRALLLRERLKKLELRYSVLRDGLFSVCDQALATGLKSRWAPKRLQSPDPSQGRENP